MSKIIAGIYEVGKQIGAGGGGIVYLGKHLRLNKEIVLKADKRTLNIGTEVLRREVDLLKGLSHTYIPQVYDFVQEEETVYTVMDFIAGESMDKLLARGSMLQQSEIIKWACQLLEALEYLHSCPPHGILHGDIKPANIMLRPNGDICLIDFNIALALGAEGAVKVGFSRGYASPEHYGIEYRKAQPEKKTVPMKQKPARIQDKINESTELGTVTETDEETEADIEMEAGKAAVSVGYSTSGGRVLLDVRSDIYSLGATLYHLLSGNRPPQDAKLIRPLGEEYCSKAVSQIIEKAMMEDPDQRYQSAQEMRKAFLQLYNRDERVRKHKKQVLSMTGMCLSLFLMSGISAFTGLKQMEQKQTALALAQYSEEALLKGDVSEAVKLAMQAIPDKNSVFAAPVTAQAKKALADALGVYDLSDGFKADGLIELPSAPFKLVLSPNGKYLAAVYAYEVAVFDLEKSEKLAIFPTIESALADVVFDSEQKIIYAGRDGVTAYDLEKKSICWSGERATRLSISGDGRYLAAVNRKDKQAILYETAQGKQIGCCEFSGRSMKSVENDIFADPMDTIFSWNQRGTLLAVSFEDGSIAIFDTDHLENEEIEVQKVSGEASLAGGFWKNYFVFTENGNNAARLTLFDVKKKEIVGTQEFSEPLLLKTDTDGIYLASGSTLTCFDADTQKERELAYTQRERIMDFSIQGEDTVVITDDRSYSFFQKMGKRQSWGKGEEVFNFVTMVGNCTVLGSRSSPYISLFKRESHSEAALLSYDESYIHDEARISADEQRIMLFGIEGFVIYDRMGNIVAKERLPEAEKIYDQQFIREEKDSYLEVSWYDGTIRRYNAADGMILSEEKGKTPDRSLYEEFETEKYRICSPLHGTPTVYERDSGKLLASLSEEAYLTYATQQGENLLTEYVSAEGERYGLLLDDKFQVIARLPKLCDCFNGYFLFDDGMGKLRQSRMYSFQELTALGKTYLMQSERRND